MMHELHCVFGAQLFSYLSQPDAAFALLSMLLSVLSLFMYEYLKVNKHEKIVFIFLQQPKPYGPKGL
jgi:hypothetical protein